MSYSSRIVENSKIEVQLKLFSEQMQYQQDRDNRCHDISKLSILKQGEVVNCLSNLAAVLSAGMLRSSTTTREPVPVDVHASNTLENADNTLCRLLICQVQCMLKTVFIARKCYLGRLCASSALSVQSSSHCQNSNMFIEA